MDGQDTDNSIMYITQTAKIQMQLQGNGKSNVYASRNQGNGIHLLLEEFEQIASLYYIKSTIKKLDKSAIMLTLSL